MSVRSWQMLVVGVLAQSGVGAWLLVSSSGAGPSTTSDLFASFLGGGVILLAVIAGLLALALTALLSLVGVPRLATLTTLVVGGLFLATGAGSPVFWVLPAFFLAAAVTSWRAGGT